MNTKIATTYRKFRSNPPFIRVGHSAEDALDAARTVVKFSELKDAGMVRIMAEPEDESYFSVYGEPDSPKERERIVDALEREGLWYVHADVNRSCEQCGDEQWDNVDAIGMCVYDRPTDPFVNPYVVALMRAAIDAAA